MILRWTTTFNFAKNHNEIVELYGGNTDLPGNEWYIGEPIDINSIMCMMAYGWKGTKFCMVNQ